MRREPVGSIPCNCQIAGAYNEKTAARGRKPDSVAGNTVARATCFQHLLGPPVQAAESGYDCLFSCTTNLPSSNAERPGHKAPAEHARQGISGADQSWQRTVFKCPLYCVAAYLGETQNN